MDVTRTLMAVRIRSAEEVAQAAEEIEQRAERIANVTYTHPNEDGSLSTESQQAMTDPAMQVAQEMGERAEAPASFARAGRNDPCPCGSGKKFKLCHGKLA